MVHRKSLLKVTITGNLVTMVVVFTLLVTGCTPGIPAQATLQASPSPAETFLPAPVSTQNLDQRLRVTNQSAISVQNLVVIFPDERIDFGDVPAGATTAYQVAPRGVYQYAAYDVEVDGQEYQQPVVDWVGETPMTGAAFTYTIDVDPARWKSEGLVVRLIDVSTDPAASDSSPSPQSPTPRPSAGSPGMLLEMFDGHSVDPEVQQPIFSLYRLDEDGNLYTLYTPPVRVPWGASGYDVSPDGQWLVFAQPPSTLLISSDQPASAQFPTDLYKIRTDGTALVRLTEPPGNETSPVWAADGQSILYVHSPDDQGPSSLARMDAVGQPLEVAPVAAPYMQNLHPSPDGNSLLYSAVDEQAQTMVLFLVNLATGEQTRLGVEGGQGGIWSPDGTQIVFAGEPGGNQVMHYDTKTSQVQPLELPSDFSQVLPAGWSPDGRSLVLENSLDDRTEIWLWDMQTGIARNLTPNARYPLHFLAWSGAANQMLVRASLNGPLSQLDMLDITTGALYPITGLPDLTMGVNLAAWRDLPPMPAGSEPLIRSIQVAPEALPTLVPASKSDLWVTIQGSGEDVANARSGPGTSFDVIGSIGAGKRIQVVAISPGGEWLQFRYPHTVSGLAWIYGALTDYSPQMGALPQADHLPPAPPPPG